MSDIIIPPEDKSRIMEIYDELVALNNKYGAPYGGDPIGIVAYLYQTSTDLGQPAIDEAKKRFFALLHSADPEKMREFAYSSSRHGVSDRSDPANEIESVFKELSLLHDEICRLSYPIDTDVLYVRHGPDTTADYFLARSLNLDGEIRVALYYMNKSQWPVDIFIPAVRGMSWYVEGDTLRVNRNSSLQANMLLERYRVATEADKKQLELIKTLASEKRRAAMAQKRAEKKAAKADGTGTNSKS